MKQEIIEIVDKSILNLSDIDINELGKVDFDIQTPKKKEFGDFSTNVALIVSSKLKLKPRDVAKKLVDEISSNDFQIIDKMEIAGPGFINFFLKENSFVSKLTDIYNEGSNFGSSDIGKNQKVNVEFVSANPTGYLHFGHGRNAVVGDTIARILSFTGFSVTREFYINDAGMQMEMLAESVYAHYMKMLGKDYEFPKDGYNGDYIKDIATDISDKVGNLYSDNKLKGLEYCKNFAYKRLIDEMRTDLKNLRVDFDVWYSEKKEIHNNEDQENKIELIRRKLDKSSALDSRDGALWFKATEYGDSQDWVLIKSDNSPTYFMADIAYHDDKYSRGYNKLINIWGADHHSHFSRLKAAMSAINNNSSLLDVVLIQFVRLIKDGKEVSMSKRSGTYITLREVLEEVGCDVSRFFLLMRNSDSHLDFDLNLAVQQSKENPVFYIQYAHARISSILKKAANDSVNLSDDNLNLLNKEDEHNIVKKLLQFPEVVESSAKLLSPHKIVYYLQELASEFHIYYNKSKIVNLDDKSLSSARLFLVRCVQIVINNGLKLLGVKSPERM